jgi:hypothetical protein
MSEENRITVTDCFFVNDYSSALSCIGDLTNKLSARDAEIAELRKDAELLDYMETQCMFSGIQDIYEINSWEIKGPFATIRMAIDADIAKRAVGR